MFTGLLLLALLQTPSVQEVEGILKQEFQGALRLGAKPAIEPQFITGDFNGDGFRDLVAVTQLIPSTEKRKAAFRLYLPGLCIANPMGNEFDQETLSRPAIAVLHGDKKRGWAKPSKRQKHVILGGVLLRQPLTMKSYQPTPDDDKAPPLRARGAILLLLNQAGTGNALYWNEECYDDYPLGQDPTKSR